MKKLIIGIACAVASLAMAAGETKPNIIFIVGDDCGYNEFSFNGGKFPTPHIDAIAKGGVILTNGYVSSAVCSPSRAGLLTGRYQYRFGIYGNPPHKNVAAEGMPLDERMLPEALKTAGYRTIGIGKWHLGWDRKFWPGARGFDDFYGFIGGSRSYFPLKNPVYHQAIMLNDKVAGAETFAYTTDEFGTQAASYIDRNKDQPFFLYLSFNATHNPKDVLPADLKAGGKPIPGMTIAMDRAVGTVLDALDRNHLAENTMVVFFSDNGGQTGHTNRPLRGFKHDVYEGGIHVPFVVRWPKVIPAGNRYDKPVIALDLYATALAMAGLPMPATKPLDGINLIPFLTGKDDADPHASLFWIFGKGWAVREGNLKLVHNRDRLGPPELFDLSDDLGEKRDLAKSKPEIVQRLQTLFDNWKSSSNAKPLWGETKGAKGDD